MTIAIIGHGYVGLVSAAVFSDLGNTVWCVGRTPAKIAKLKKGIIPFYEPGLVELVGKNIKAGRLRFTLDYSEAVPVSEVVFICVGTPSTDEGEADLSSVYGAASEIGKNLTDYTVVGCKSTVPIGVNRKVAKLVSKVKSKKASFDIASCPEFLREGTAIYDTLNPDRIVIGTDSTRAKKVLLELHKPINGKFVTCGIETAEMIKYAANSILSTKISFANAISFLCEATGADIGGVMEGIGLDKRIGSQFLSAGIGFGGSCFPKDVKALVAIAADYGYDFGLLKEVNKINLEAADRFVKKVKKALGGKVKGKTVAVLGLSFKPNTDDMREAPSIKVLTPLILAGAKIKAYDPEAGKTARAVFGDKISYEGSAYEAVKDAQILLVLTEWNEFKQLSLRKVKSLMKKPVVVDGRNIYDPVKMGKMGFIYIGVGRNNNG